MLKKANTFKVKEVDILKKLPTRTCIGCNRQKLKKDFIRIVKNAQGEIKLDKTGKLPGRGAYICNQPECLEKAIRSKKLERSFETKIEEKIYEELRNTIKVQEV